MDPSRPKPTRPYYKGNQDKEKDVPQIVCLCVCVCLCAPREKSVRELIGKLTSSAQSRLCSRPTSQGEGELLLVGLQGASLQVPGRAQKLP